MDYNTSAPNVVQRWFRAIMRRAKAHGLPLPSLPRRCVRRPLSSSSKQRRGPGRGTACGPARNTVATHNCVEMCYVPVICRALLADVSHSRGCGAAAGVDVLSAEEVRCSKPTIYI